MCCIKHNYKNILFIIAILAINNDDIYFVNITTSTTKNYSKKMYNLISTNTAR